MKIGIYKITNKLNGKVYIGQSVDIEKRIKRHFSEAFNITSSEIDKPLYKSIRKYGSENFISDILQECSKEELDILETYYINFYNSCDRDFGYNLALGGDGNNFYKSDFEDLNDITILLLEGVLTNKEIAKMYGVSEQHISNINVGRTWFRENLVYPIKSMYKVAERPNPETLIQEIKATNMVQVAKKYGVSDSTIRKWLKKYGLPISPKVIKNM